MAEIKSIAIAGASGTLGPHVLKALVDANFEVMVLTRSKKPGAYDDSVKVVEVDFTSVKSLTAALKCVDVLVSTVAAAAIPSQTILIDAAVAAGVKRFIPSEFGSVPITPKVAAFPLYSSMFQIKKHLEEHAKTENLTWTVLVCGAFLELLLGSPMLLDFPNHKAELIDGGNNRISSTSLPNIGKAIVGILNNFETTKNKIVKVSEVILTQNQLLSIAGELRPDINWEISNIKASEVLQEGLDGVSAGDLTAFLKIAKGIAGAGDVYGAAYDETDNELLGVKTLTVENLRSIVAGKLA